MSTCPPVNTVEKDQSSFWGADGIDWDAHRIGWVVSGGCSIATVFITLFSVYTHARNYHNPPEQRQIIRILYMPPIYSILSFLSYRFFREYTYFELIQVVYEAVTISAFMLLIIEYVASTASDRSATKAMQRKDKRALPFPFYCWRYRPTKPYFMYTVKWSVMQYVIVRPLVSIIGIICEALDILCGNGGFNFHFAYVYLEIVDFISITVALYGLIVLHGLTHEELVNRRPLAKFLCIKLMEMFTFYQAFLFRLLEGRVIHETRFWTATNIVDGLTALTVCIEMVFFSAAMLWAFSASEYRDSEKKKTNIGPALWDSINYSDFVKEIWSGIWFFIDYARDKPGTHSAKDHRANFGEAFGVTPSQEYPLVQPSERRRLSYRTTDVEHNDDSRGRRWGSGMQEPDATSKHYETAMQGGGDSKADMYADDVHLVPYVNHDRLPTPPPTYTAT